MTKRNRLDRRSFLARVAGGALGGSALVVLGSDAGAEKPKPGERRMVVDADPSDPARMPEPIAPPGIGLTDSDAGPNGDPASQGRTPRAPTRSSDSDSGANSDASGSGGSGPRESFVICPGNPRCPS